MSFDARSLERLQALGRQLPQPLPTPKPAASSTRPEPKLHAIEREQDPDQLFRELMQASADGTVPPHLLDRLRQLEEERASLPQRGPGRPGAEPGQAPASATTAQPRRSPRLGRSTKGSRPPALSSEERNLYDAFEDLLHLQDDEAAPEPTTLDRQRRAPQIELQPKPTQRRAQEGR
jgi:hypothetical protein